MANQTEPGMVSILKALRDLIDLVPQEGQTVDWKKLQQKKEVGKRAITTLEDLFSKDPLKAKSIICDDFPKIWN